MCLKRFLILLLVLFSFCFYSVASEIQQGLTDIETFAINIQNNSLQQQKQIELLTIDLAESQKLLEDYMKQQKEMSQMQKNIIETTELLRTQIQELENICYGSDSIDDYYNYWDNIYGLQ